jgi:hypothetical protein
MVALGASVCDDKGVMALPGERGCATSPRSYSISEKCLVLRQDRRPAEVAELTRPPKPCSWIDSAADAACCCSGRKTAVANMQRRSSVSGRNVRVQAAVRSTEYGSQQQPAAIIAL